MIGFLLPLHSNGDTEAGALMFVFYFDKVPTLAMLELMCVCDPYTSRIKFKLFNNASLYKGLLLFVYTHNENKTI